MAGNTRGKLKEHFEGIHRNLDWCIHHVNVSLQLIEDTLRQTDEVKALGDDEKAIKAHIEKYPLYAGIKSLGTGIQTLDGLSGDVYLAI